MAIPKLALIPSTVGGSVYSVLPSNGNGDFDFTRASAATRINAQGLIETVAVGDNRLNYPLIDGVVSGCPSLLLEPARTNLVTNSNDFTSWINSGSYITAGYGISPDGSQNASRCLFTNTNQTLSKVIGTNGILSYSIYVKGVKGETINISMASGSDNSFTLNGEWQRLSYSDTVTNSTLNINTFDGKTARDLLIFGAQFELGSYPTSYIPSPTIGTRSAETCNGAGDVNTFNDSEGVLFAEIKWLDESGAYRGISVSDGLSNDNNRIQINFNQNTGNLVLNVTVGGVHQAVYSSTIFPSNFSKVGIKYKENDFAFWVNGIEIYTDNLGITYPANTLSELKFNSPLGAVPFYGNIKQIQYFNTALTDSDLETLTSWVSFTDMANGQQYTIE
jgi:hypothetical protein